MSLAVLVVICALALRLLASTLLDLLNLACVKAHASDIPARYSGLMDLSEYKKGVAYTIDKIRFGIVESACSAIFLSVLLVFGILPYLFSAGIECFGASVWGQSLAIIFIALILSIPDLPFDWYSQFVIERKYGFNKSSQGLWIADKLKGLCVAVVLGIPILTLILWFPEVFKHTWWLWGFLAVAVFQVVMIVIYPRFIVPLFNKLEDLPDGELKSALFNLAERGGFHARAIQVIDGSKRSSHSNAYFTGFGKFKRIVLFDTLIEQLSQSELEAVLAHEMGHYKKGHILKMMLLSFAMTFAAFAFMGWLSVSEWFYAAFGFSGNSGFAPVLLIFSIYSGAFTFWFSPILNVFSRRNEYEADRFSAGLCGGDSLRSALRKLHVKNLGNLTPHPLYSAFYYSHPTLFERERALEK